MTTERCEYPGCSTPGLRIAAQSDPTIGEDVNGKPSLAFAVACGVHVDLVRMRLLERHAPSLAARRGRRPRR